MGIPASGRSFVPLFACGSMAGLIPSPAPGTSFATPCSLVIPSPVDEDALLSPIHAPPFAREWASARIGARDLVVTVNQS